MNLLTLARIIIPICAAASCANTAPTPPPTTGSTGGSMTAPEGSGGGAGTGGATGGAPGSSGSGGASETGGATGTGGVSGTGGKGEEVDASGGGTGGTSGAEPDAAAKDGPSMTGEPGGIVGAFDGALLTFPCGGSATGFDCANVGCTGKEVTHTTVYRVGGQAGTVYNMTFRVRGVVEGYQYQGGTRDQGTTSQATNPDLFYQGGQGLPAGGRGSDYNTYQLTVAPPVAGAPNTYFLNSIPVNPRDPGAVHLTFVADFTKTIKISGGGTITFSTFDSNCRTVMNCEKSANNNCANHWTVPLTGATPAPPASFMQPYQM